MKIASALLCFVVALASAKEWNSSTPLVEPLRPKELPDSKIVGGSETQDTWPWQVALYITGWYMFCGGVIIGENWVLTAAHCLGGATHVRVVAGVHKVFQDTEQDNEQARDATTFIVHDDYNSAFLNNDIALIYIDDAFVFNDHVAAAKYRRKRWYPVGREAKLIGWGMLFQGAPKLSDVLMEVDVPTLYLAECEAYYYKEYMYDGLICIDTSGSKGPCMGDSGGGMMMKFKGQDLVIGLSSFSSSEGCQAGRPACYTNIAYFKDWIIGKTGIGPA